MNLLTLWKLIVSAMAPLHDCQHVVVVFSVTLGTGVRSDLEFLSAKAVLLTLI